MSRRILLADDSVTIQKVIELTFMDEDLEVRAVSNGDEAIAALPQARPDFVIADVHMPGANGYEVCRRSKQLLPDVPVLLLVGTFEPFDEAQARAAGADSFLKKPFDSQELLQRVQELLATHAAPAPVAAVPAKEPAEEPFELPAESPWPSFDLEAEAGPGPAYVREEPLAREEPFILDDRSYQVEEDRPFALSEDDGSLAIEEPSITLRDEAGEPAFSEPQDRYLEDVERPVPTDEAAPVFAPWELTDQERLGIPLGQEPLVASLEEAEARIESPRGPEWGGVGPHEPVATTTHAPPTSPLASPAAFPETEVPWNGAVRLSDEDVDRIARRVVELIGDKVVRDVAWEVVPDLAEVVIKDRIRELESQVD